MSAAFYEPIDINRRKGYEMPHRRRIHVASVLSGFVVLLGLALAPTLAPDLSSGQVLAQQASSTCTEIIGFSQTEGWYDGGFSASVPNPGNWQLRWYSGGSVDFWADPNFAGWAPGALV